MFVHADFATYPNIHLMFSDCSHFDVALLFLASSFPLISGIYCGEEDFIVHVSYYVNDTLKINIKNVAPDEQVH